MRLQHKSNQVRTHNLPGTLLLGLGLTIGLGACPIPTRQKPRGGKGPEAAKVVVLTLHGALTEDAHEASPFGRHETSLRKMLRRLRLARTAKKVKTIVLRIGRLGAGWAELAELRQAIGMARAAGKRVVAHLDDAGNREYYLASAANDIAMSESGSLWLVGLAARVTFIKNLLDKLGIQAEFLHQGRYKGAADPLTRSTMSDAMKESLGALLDDTFAELVAAISKGRKLPMDRVRALIDQSPHDAEACKRLGLVDRVVDHRADTEALAGGGSVNWTYGRKKEVTGTLRSLMKLLRPSEMTKPPRSPHVALIYAEGPILYGPRRRGFSVGRHIASTPVVRLLAKLRAQDQVKAVVIRINSGGGSALASELIWQAVRRLAKKKPVVISMGDVAASGGYYIASAGHVVFARPNTITGSIGVVGGKLSLAGLFQKIGVTSEVITRGARADLFTLARSWTPEERRLLQAYMARTYRLFLGRVATGRKLTVDAVRRIAQGRVWSGRAALKHHLVDRLGGLLDAVAEAKRLSKLPASSKTAVYPRPKTWIERLQEDFGASATQRGPLGRVLGTLLATDLGGLDLRPVLLLLRSWRRERVLAWMPVQITIR